MSFLILSLIILKAQLLPRTMYINMPPSFPGPLPLICPQAVLGTTLAKCHQHVSGEGGVEALQLYLTPKNHLKTKGLAFFVISLSATLKDTLKAKMATSWITWNIFLVNKLSPCALILRQLSLILGHSRGSQSCICWVKILRSFHHPLETCWKMIKNFKTNFLPTST